MTAVMVLLKLAVLKLAVVTVGVGGGTGRRQ
jgi:hypothetical protein